MDLCFSCWPLCEQLQEASYTLFWSSWLAGAPDLHSGDLDNAALHWLFFVLLFLVLHFWSFRSPLYDQATQDGCSLALCMSPAWPVPASLTPYSHEHPCALSQLVLILRNGSTCNFKGKHLSLWWSLTITGAVRDMTLLLVSLVTNEQTWCLFQL